MRQCDCCERIGVKINSIKLFEELQSFFDEQVEQGIFSEKRMRELYFKWKGFFEKTNCYADKWYKCNVCGVLWEFKYPDFPANGYVRKFPDGKYTGKEVVKDGY